MKGRVDPHGRFRELLAARLDRPLTRVELRGLTAHLKNCSSCQQVDHEYRANRDLLRALPPSFPPRDMWARTSAALDREVARGYRVGRWTRRRALARRSAQPSSSLMTAVAAIGVIAAIAVLQLAPAFSPSASAPGKPTPFAVIPQPLAFIGLGSGDIAVYRTQVTQVCPQSAPIDCVETERIVRTPVGFPPSMRSGNIALSPSGKQLAVVGHYVGEDVIAVVTMPTASESGEGGRPADSAPTPDAPQVQSTHAPGIDGEPTAQPTDAAPADTSDPASPAPGASGEPATDAPDSPSTTPDASAVPATESPAIDPNATPVDPASPTTPPASALPGLAVLNILEDVQSAGTPPAWSPNGEMLAFSAMPVDESHGPDVYVWSPGDRKARAITSDHASFFASWSGNRIVVSRLVRGPSNGQRPQTLVIDPQTLEERAVQGPQVWLPTVNTARTQAIAWYGQLDTAGALPSPRSGALYVMDWARIDPYAGNSQPPATDGEQPAAEQIPDSGDASPSAGGTTGEPTPGITDDSTPGPKADAEQSAGGSKSDGSSANVPSSLLPLDPDRDPRSAPVLDWQVRWSNDGLVLGVWIADSAGSPWGRLAVLAVDPESQRVTRESPLLATTLARRGFSLGMSRVAWVGPSDTNLDGELRIRTWGDDGVGGLRLRAPEEEELLPAF